MELDEIKKVWGEIDSSGEKLQVNEKQTKETLKKEGESALVKLIRFTKFRAIAAIPLGLLMFIFMREFFEAGGYYMIFPLIFMLIIILWGPLRIYQYRLLKKIDYSGMSVKEVSEKILKYQNLVHKHKMYGTMFFFIFMGVWIALSYILRFGSVIHWGLIIYAAVLYLAGGLFFIPFLYKKLYYNSINRIKENLKELKEFE